MKYLIGFGMALALYAFHVGQIDRERVFDPTLLTVIATYYMLAVMGSSKPVLAIGPAVPVAFLVLAVAGFKKNLRLQPRSPETEFIQNPVSQGDGAALPFLRHSRGRFSSHAADAAFRICTDAF